MYQVTDAQEKEIQGWIAKLPDSIVKSQITTLWEGVFPTHRLRSEQLEKFLSFQNALPKEFQTYPQVVAQWFKNPSEETAKSVAHDHAHIKDESKETHTKHTPKPKEQQKEEERIIAANKAVGEPKPKTKKP